MREIKGDVHSLPIAKAKLVRDYIPDLITADGRRPDIRIATHAEFHELLRAKLLEEVEEFLATEDPDELADILEVIHALGAQSGLTPSDLESLRTTKAANRGRFDRRIILYI